MKKFDTAQARAQALDLLYELRDMPSMNKEKFYLDASAYYAWFLTYEEEAGRAVPVYFHEFAKHHGRLMKKLSLASKMACFIAWFVENEFHLNPPIVHAVTGEAHPHLDIPSSPSFCLPTGNTAYGFILQWCSWYKSHRRQAEEITPQTLAGSMAGSIHEFRKLSPEEMQQLYDDAVRFFTWCKATTTKFQSITGVLCFFSDTIVARSIPPCDYLLTDAALVKWFCQNDMDSPEWLAIIRDEVPEAFSAGLEYED